MFQATPKLLNYHIIVRRRGQYLRQTGSAVHHAGPDDHDACCAPARRLGTDVVERTVIVP